jgi:phytanoyl-CoA hydroxylase
MSATSTPAASSAPASQSGSPFPLVDARSQRAITAAQAEFFRANGLLVLRGVLHGEELAALQRQTQTLVEQARAGTDHPDFFYRDREGGAPRIPFRVEYVIDKRTACRALLGHPFILRSVEALQGQGFIPTWDSMVFKNAGAGAGIPWHRDAGTHAVHPELSHRFPIFNVDFYLDRADRSNCVWGILGSNTWAQERADAAIAELNHGGFQHLHGAVPITMEPGDVILHNILALHGSPPTTGALRRVIYYEFRPGPIERAMGPHTPPYLGLKQRVLLACQRERARTAYAAREEAYAYAPEPGHEPANLLEGEELATHRYPHHEYWRA